MTESLTGTRLKCAELILKMERALEGTLGDRLRLNIEKALVQARELYVLVAQYESDEELEANQDLVHAKVKEMDETLGPVPALRRELDAADEAYVRGYAAGKIKQAIEEYIREGKKAPETEEEFKTMMLTVMSEEAYNRIDQLTVGEHEIAISLLAWAGENGVGEWAEKVFIKPKEST